MDAKTKNGTPTTNANNINIFVVGISASKGLKYSCGTVGRNKTAMIKRHAWIIHWRRKVNLVEIIWA